MNREERWLLEEKYQGKETPGFFEDCERLQHGEPLAYVLGSIPFLHTNIFLDSHPLIPRPETEFWVEKAIAEIQSSAIETPKVLDLCAGSGCIGVAVLTSLPQTHVDFIELETAHVPTIEKNCATNGVSKNRYSLFTGNLFATTITNPTKYDFILTNPPYIDATQGTTDQSVLLHEPHLALFGGKDGMILITQIISGAKKHLQEDGVLYIEHEPEQAQAITELANANGFSITTHNDQYKVPRYSRLRVAQL